MEPDEGSISGATIDGAASSSACFAVPSTPVPDPAETPQALASAIAFARTYAPAPPGPQAMQLPGTKQPSCDAQAPSTVALTKLHLNKSPLASVLPVGVEAAASAAAAAVLLLLVS